MQRTDLPKELMDQIIVAASNKDYSTWTKLRIATKYLAEQAEINFPKRIQAINQIQSRRAESILKKLPGHFRSYFWHDMRDWVETPASEVLSRSNVATLTSMGSCLGLAFISIEVRRLDITAIMLLSFCGIPIAKWTYDTVKFIRWCTASMQDNFKLQVNFKRI